METDREIHIQNVIITQRLKQICLRDRRRGRWTEKGRKRFRYEQYYTRIEIFERDR